MVLLEESLPALATNVRPQRTAAFWMPPLMRQQAVFSCEAFTAIVAEVYLRPRSGYRMIRCNDLRVYNITGICCRY